MSAEAMAEVAIYFHKFHNLDLFQQGWYRIRVTSAWEGSEPVAGFPSRVLQYDDEGSDDSVGVWQINDEDHSFCTRPFLVKYARQDVILAIMVSFNLYIKSIEMLTNCGVVISFELLHAAINGAQPSSALPLEYSLCATQEYRIPPKAVLGVHSYCPLSFDAWHMVLVDVTVHSTLFKVKSHSNRPTNGSCKENMPADKTLETETRQAETHDTPSISSQDLALWKTLYTSRNILKYELEALSSAIYQEIELEAVEDSDITRMNELLESSSEEVGGGSYGRVDGISNSTFKGPDENEELPEYSTMREKEGDLPNEGRDPNRLLEIHKKDLMEGFQALSDNIYFLWNNFLKFHRLNRTSLWENLQGAWAEERSTEWAMWMTHSKMDIRVQDIFDEGVNSIMHSGDKLSAQKAYEEPALTSATHAELHRKSLENMKINSRSLQDLQIFGNMGQPPVIHVESHTIRRKEISEADEQNKALSPSPSLLSKTSKYHGRPLRVVVFVHGFQGHHLDLRLVRNHWLMLDPDAEFLMSEFNEDQTTGDFREMGHRLAEEVMTFLKTRFGRIIRSANPETFKLSFVGHSMGNLIIRAALTEASMKPFLPYLYTFLSVSGPHLGYLYSSNILFNSGLWLLKKLKASPCMHQLTFTDATNIHDTFLYKLSQESTLEHFRHVILLSSPQDRYVPYHSARIEMCEAARRDQRRGSAYASMLQNCLKQILMPCTVDRCFIRFDVNFNTSAQAGSLNNFIGRTAHIEFLETDIYLRFIMWIFPQYFH